MIENTSLKDFLIDIYWYFQIKHVMVFPKDF